MPTVITSGSSNGKISFRLSNQGLGFFNDIQVNLPETPISGGIVKVSIDRVEGGYKKLNQYLSGIYSCEVGGPPAGGTTAQIILDSRLQVGDTTSDNFVLVTCAGSGYTSAPTITAPEPNSQSLSGAIGSISIITPPIGYVLSSDYPLTIAASPITGGTAEGKMTVDANGVAIALLSNRGFGYTTAPTITVTGPKHRQWS